MIRGSIKLLLCLSMNGRTRCEIDGSTVPRNQITQLFGASREQMLTVVSRGDVGLNSMEDEVARFSWWFFLLLFLLSLLLFDIRNGSWLDYSLRFYPIGSYRSCHTDWEETCHADSSTQKTLDSNCQASRFFIFDYFAFPVSCLKYVCNSRGILCTL